MERRRPRTTDADRRASSRAASHATRALSAPGCDAVEPTLPYRGKIAHRAHSVLGGILVLVVEDHADSRELFRSMLECHGAIVTTAMFNGFIKKPVDVDDLCETAARLLRRTLAG